MNKESNQLYTSLVKIISETNGLTLSSTLELWKMVDELDSESKNQIVSFSKLLDEFQINQANIDQLFTHPVGLALYKFFKNFPLKYREEHTHLTGALSADFVFPRLEKLLNGPNKDKYIKIIELVYGKDVGKIDSIEKVDRLMRLGDKDLFDRYLEILLLPKLILTSEEAHFEASYNMAQELYYKYNVGAVRLKFMLSRATTNSKEDIPGSESLTSEAVVKGLFGGFKKFQKEHPDFQFILSPSFRKEANFYDAKNFKTKQEHFDFQVKELLELLENSPDLQNHVTEVDTVGSERGLYRKEHFNEMKYGLRKLQTRGLKIRSHHGETWETLRFGIQSVDNAMNIWHVDAVEHGLSLGINPNFYFHRIYQKVIELNKQAKKLEPKSQEYREVVALDWRTNKHICDKLVAGELLTKEEAIYFVKAKFHMARELEHYQHDVLNRMIDKELSVIALPSSNKRLTGQFQDYKEHPFSWWEKKGLKLGVGTDNYITLNTDYIREMLILLFTDANQLKITKLLMVCSGEKRRPYISQKLWNYRKICKFLLILDLNPTIFGLLW